MLYEVITMKDYIVTDFPKSRIATFDVGKLGSRKHQITGLIEVDVTDARKKIKTQLTQGRSAGFIPWLIKCIAATVAEDPAVQAINKGRITSYNVCYTKLLRSSPPNLTKISLRRIL